MLCAGQGAYGDDAKSQSHRRRWPICWAEGSAAHLETGAAMSPRVVLVGQCWACLCRGFWRSKSYLIEEGICCFLFLFVFSNSLLDLSGLLCYTML